MQNSIAIAPPLEAELLLTSRCNMRCPHCCANAKHNVGDNFDLPTSVWLDAIKQLLKMGVQTFTLTGGEPTLHIGFMDFVKTINSLGAYCAITTNAYFINKSFIDDLMSLELDISKISFHISIDGPEEKHDEFRKTPGAFKNAINAMKSLNAVGIQARTNFMLTSESVEWFDDLEKIVSEAGCTSINVGQCAPVGRNNISIEYETWCKFVKDTTYKQKEGKYTCHTRCMSHGIWQVYLPLLDQKNDAYTIWGKKPEITDDCKTCPAGVFTIAIDGKGWVYPCDLMTTYPELRCGNIQNSKIIDIWNNSPVLRDLRSVDYRNMTPCSTCFFSEECHSGCRGATYGLTGSLEAPDIRCPIVSNYKKDTYPEYKSDFKVQVAECTEISHFEKSKTLTVFHSQIKLIQYNYGYIAKSKWTGNSFMIVNPFGYKVLKMIESGVDFRGLIERLCGKNDKVKCNLEKKIVSFLMELVAKKIISYRETKNYLYFTNSTPISSMLEKQNNELPPIIYHKVNENYLVYITKTPKIVLVNETCFYIIRLYLEGKSIEKIAQGLLERYIGCTEKQVLNDIRNTLKQAQL